MQNGKKCEMEFRSTATAATVNRFCQFKYNVWLIFRFIRISFASPSIQNDSIYAMQCISSSLQHINLLDLFCSLRSQEATKKKAKLSHIDLFAIGEFYRDQHLRICFFFSSLFLSSFIPAPIKKKYDCLFCVCRIFDFRWSTVLQFRWNEWKKKNQEKS